MRGLTAFAAISLLGGCEAAGPQYLERDVVRVAVLPPFNDTAASNEDQERFWGCVEHQASVHGYQVIPRAEVKALYQQKHFNIPEEITQMKPAEICDALKVDGIFYDHITFWGKTTMIVSTKVGVSADFRLVDRTGFECWSAEGEDNESTGGSTVKDMVGGAAAGALLMNPAKHCEPAVRKGFASLPLAGRSPQKNPK